jgi:hypothetical protein
MSKKILPTPYIFFPGLQLIAQTGIDIFTEIGKYENAIDYRSSCSRKLLIN